MRWQTLPICDGCWPLWAVTTLGHVPEPPRMKEPHRDEEDCCQCGIKTRSGIYIREREGEVRGRGD